MDPDANKVPTPDMRAPGESDKSPTGSASMPMPSSEKLMPKESTSQTAQLHPQVPASASTHALPLMPKQQDYVNPAQTRSARPATAAQTISDLAIEKECIAKAKAIVEQTSSDPYRETKEIVKV